MADPADPIVGEWYHLPRKAQKFFVVALDEQGGGVEIQYFDGTLDELAITEWYALGAERIEAPEDWTGPMDEEKDVLFPSGTEMRREDWAAPYDEDKEKRDAGPRAADYTEEETGED